MIPDAPTPAHTPHSAGPNRRRQRRGRPCWPPSVHAPAGVSVADSVVIDVPGWVPRTLDAFVVVRSYVAAVRVLPRSRVQAEPPRYFRSGGVTEPYARMRRMVAAR